MHIQRQQLQEIERSLNEMIRAAHEYSNSLEPDGMKRRLLETDQARADRVSGDIRGMLNK